MRKLKILLGMGKVGKTTFAKKQKEQYIDFDSFGPYGSKEAFEKALSNIADHVNSHKENDFILDGYVYLKERKLIK